MLITHKTARQIAEAYREIETAERLVTDIKAAKARAAVPGAVDEFTVWQNPQLSVPNSPSTRCTFQMPWAITIQVIEAHIAAQRDLIAALSGQARAELENAPADATEG